MASREALRDFQGRLADRLKQARASGASASWLALVAGGRRLLFPLSHSGEIFPMVPLQRVPYTRDWFLGVGNLRGNLFGVVDIGAYLSGNPVAARSETQLGQCRVVVFNPVFGLNCGLLVDSLVGLRNPEAFVRSGASAAGAPGYFGHLYTDERGLDWQEINLQSLSQQPEFLFVSA